MKCPIAMNSIIVVGYTPTVFEVFSVKHGRGRVLNRSQYSLLAIGADKVVVDDKGRLKCSWASDLLHAGDREEGESQRGRDSLSTESIEQKRTSSDDHNSYNSSSTRTS